MLNIVAETSLRRCEVQVKQGKQYIACTHTPLSFERSGDKKKKS